MGRAPKRVTTVAATCVANSAAAARSARAGAAELAGATELAGAAELAGVTELAGAAGTARVAGAAGTAASHLLMKAPQKASPAPVVSVARTGCAATRSGASPGTARTQPAAPSFTTTTP